MVHVLEKYESLVMVLNLDALSMLPRNILLRNVYEILVSSLYRNIVIIQKTILKHFQQSGGDHSKISYPEIFHFFPKECGHFITRVYAKNESECSLGVLQSCLTNFIACYLFPIIYRTG